MFAKVYRFVETMDTLNIVRFIGIVHNTRYEICLQDVATRRSKMSFQSFFFSSIIYANVRLHFVECPGNSPKLAHKLPPRERLFT